MPKTTVSSVAPADVVTKNGQQVVPWTQGPELNGDRVVMVLKNKPFRAYDMTSGMASRPDSFFGAENSWAPMFGDIVYKSDAQSDGKKPIVIYSGVLGELCHFEGGEAAREPWCQDGKCHMDFDDLQVKNFPCKLNWGRGLYYTTYKGDPDSPDPPALPPSSDFKCGLSTGTPGFSNCFGHIGDRSPRLADGNANIMSAAPIEGSSYVNQGYPTTGLSFDPIDECKQGGCFLYFKIIDRYYGINGKDNFGAYTIEFKQGVKTSYHQPITKFVALFKGLLCNVSEQFYNGIIKSTEFANYIRVLLILVVIGLGLGVLTGFVELTYAQLLILALKIGLVLQISTTQYSWDFFNQRFFNFFINGVDEVTGIIFGASNADLKPINVNTGYLPPGDKKCSTQTLSGFLYFDQVVSQLFSRETAAKAASLWLYFFGAGIIYYVIIYICIIFMLFVIVKAIISYLVSFLTMAIIIGFAPLFLPFMLFEQTRDLFDRWLKALISYFIQPIIILTFAFFMLQIFLSQFHNLLGYRVCWKPFFQFPYPFYYNGKPIITLWAWQADYDKDAKLCMLTPNAIISECDSKDPDCDAVKKFKDGDTLSFMGQLNVQKVPGNKPCGIREGPSGKPDQVCNPYVCAQERYVGFPYLDPDLTMDQDRINELQGKTWSHMRVLVGFLDMVLMVLTMWFLYEFSKTVPNIAKQIATGSGFSGGVNVGGAAGQFFNAAQRLGGAPYAFIKKMPGVTHLRALRSGLTALPGQLKERAVDKWYSAENSLAKMDNVAGRAGLLAMKTIRNTPGFVKSAIDPNTAKGLVSSPLAPFKIAKVVTTPGRELLGLTKGGKKVVDAVEKTTAAIAKPFKAVANIPSDLKKFRDAAKADLLDRVKEPFRKLDDKINRQLGDKDVIVDKRSETLYGQVNEALAAGKNTRALYLARKAYEKDPGSTLLKKMYANALEKNGEDLYKARGLLEDAMKKGDRSAQVDYARVSKTIADKEQKYDHLSKALQQMSLEDHSKLSTEERQKMEQKMEQTQSEKLQRGAELGRADDLKDLAKKYTDEKNFSDAYKLYEKALELNPQDAKVKEEMQANHAEFEAVKQRIEQRKKADKLIEERDEMLEKQNKWSKRLENEGVEKGALGGLFVAYGSYGDKIKDKTNDALKAYKAAAKDDDKEPDNKVGDSEAAMKVALLHADQALDEGRSADKAEKEISKFDKQITETDKEIDRLLAIQHKKEKDEQKLRELEKDIAKAKSDKEAEQKKYAKHIKEQQVAEANAKSVLADIKGAAAANADRLKEEEKLDKPKKVP